MQVYNRQKNYGLRPTKTETDLENNPSLSSVEANMQLFNNAATGAVFLALIVGETSAATVPTRVRQVDPRARMSIAEY